MKGLRHIVRKLEIAHPRIREQRAKRDAPRNALMYTGVWLAPPKEGGSVAAWGRRNLERG